MLVKRSVGQETLQNRGDLFYSYEKGEEKKWNNSRFSNYPLFEGAGIGR
jgi:hypothetical protein